MANAEKSYRDRQGRSQILIDTCAVFTPTYTPGDNSLTVTNFTTFLVGVDAANTNVENLEVNYTNNATARIAVVKTIRDAATQAVAYVKSNTAWATQFKAVKMAADKLRGVSPPSKPVPPPPVEPGGEPPAAAEKRNKGEQAYVELQAHLSALITALTACAGYAPPSLSIALSTFNGLLSQFRGLNMFICQIAGQLTTAREARRGLYYDGPECLEKKFQGIKNSVKGQYGQNSSQYAAVKGVKW
jgi:hypothetical protein